MSPKQKALAYTAAYIAGSFAIGGAVVLVDYLFGTVVAGSIVAAVLLAYVANMVYTMKLYQYQSEEK